MNGRLKGIQNFRFIIFSLFLLAQPALSAYDDLADCEILSQVPALEKASLEDMAPGGKVDYQGLASNFSALMFLLAPDFLEQVSFGPSPVSSHQQASVLRC